jgi:ribosome-binding protein aMBF1 (putative translation factor)
MKEPPVREMLARLADRERDYLAELHACQKRAAEILDGVMEAIGANQRQLAARLKMNHTTLSRLRNGRGKIGEDTLRKLNKLLNG